jgi:hypothetical protein
MNTACKPMKLTEIHADSASMEMQVHAIDIETDTYSLH